MVLQSRCPAVPPTVHRRADFSFPLSPFSILKVLFINRVFPPGDGATGQLLAELGEELVRQGWTVTVLAAGGTGERRTSKMEPSADDGRPETRNPKPETKLRVERVRGLPFTRASLLRRALSYASLYPALLWRALRLPRHDVVVTLTDPPLLLVLGPWLKWFKGARLVHWAQDVYPEVAEELGVLRQGGVGAGVLRFISTWSLRRHDHVIAVGRCMKTRLVARGRDEHKITVIPNWAVGLSASQPSTLNPQPHFTVMYSGNFGLAHPFESIIEAVKLLDGQGAAVRFVFAGTGPKFTQVREQLAGCRHTEFRGHAPMNELASSLASADAHLACMNEELLGLVVPSKIYGAVAAGRPCLFLGPAGSEAAQWISSHGCGLVLPARNSGRALAEAILLWSQHGEDYQRVRRQSELLAAEAGRVPVDEFLAVLPPQCQQSA